MARILVMLLLPVVAIGQIEEPTREQVAEQIRKLESPDAKARLEAAKWFNPVARFEAVNAAADALKRACRDADGEVRSWSLYSLSVVEKRRGKPCPRIVMELLDDPVENVRYQAINCGGLFTVYEEGSDKVLLRLVESKSADTRTNALIFLARAAPKDAAVLNAIEKAKKDPSFTVRHNAHCAIFTATDRLPDMLEYLIRLREDRDRMLAPEPETEEARNVDRCTCNLAILGGASRIAEWCDTRPNDLAAALGGLLKHTSPAIRRGAATLIGAAAFSVDKDSAKLGAKDLLPYFEPKAGAPEGGEPSKFALKVRGGEVEKRLQVLRDKDVDESVRAAAKAALERLTAAGKK